MNKKITTLFSLLLILLALVTSMAKAQQSTFARAANSADSKIKSSAGANYTYRLFIAPNKVYGYDILQNGKIIYHQPAAAEPAGKIKIGLNTKPFADKAAMMTIEKIKKGIPPELSRREIAQIASQ